MSLDRKINRIQFLSGNSLKVIAVLTMLIDHLCKIVLQWLLSNYWGAMADNGQMSWERFREIDYFIRFDLQSIGTIAFPLFCFLLAEGFQHTRSKKRYIGLMLAFALISEVPFDIGFFSAYSRMEDTFPFYLKYQNVFFTLFLGLLTLVCLERFSCKSDLPVDRIKSAVLQVLSVVLFSGIAEGIHCDYGMQGILFISAFYICRNHRIYQVLLFLLAYMGTTGNQPPLCTLLACLLILLYNGKRGKLKLKYFFYTQNSSGSWKPGTTSHDNTMESMGNCIAINHVNPFNGHSDNRSGAYARSIYMHMAENPTVRPGDTVKKGQIIGTIGTTGVSSANHLHFSISVGNGSSLAPGQTGWIQIKFLPDFNPVYAFPEYSL